MRGGIAVGLVAALWPLVAQAAVLERVRIRSGDDLTVELSVSNPVVPWVRRLGATGDLPHRIYIDLPDTVLAPSVRKLLTTTDGRLARVRTGQFTPTTARIVLDTPVELPYDVSATSHRVTIALHADRDPAPAAAAPPAASPASAPRAAPPRAAPPAPPPAPEKLAPTATAPVSPPKSPEPPAPQAASADPPLVVVDAGHGGHDPGAKGIDGIQEKTVVLQIAHRLAAKLPARLPVDSLLTRSDDSFVPLAERLPHGARAPTVFVSLHANACDQPEPRGVEIFFGGPHGSRAAADGKHLARLITTELRARLLRVRGRPRPGPFRVLTANAAPSVLVEVGYLTHPEDAARLQDAKYQELFTDALVDAVAAFLQTSGDSMHAGQNLVPSDDTTRTASVRDPT